MGGEGLRCHENDTCDGTGFNDPFYTWVALLALMQVEYRSATLNKKHDYDENA